MFMCEYSHSLDPKGRVIMPAKFREGLGDQFVVCKGLDRCLYAFSNEEWENFMAQLTQLSLTNKQSRQFNRFMLAGASQVEVDKQGRILIPSPLREYANLDKDVVLAGVGHRVEIWDKAKWDDEKLDPEDIEEISKTMDGLGIMLTQ